MGTHGTSSWSGWLAQLKTFFFDGPKWDIFSDYVAPPLVLAVPPLRPIFWPYKKSKIFKSSKHHVLCVYIIFPSPTHLPHRYLDWPKKLWFLRIFSVWSGTFFSDYVTPPLKQVGAPLDHFFGHHFRPSELKKWSGPECDGDIWYIILEWLVGSIEDFFFRRSEVGHFFGLCYASTCFSGALDKRPFFVKIEESSHQLSRLRYPFLILIC